MARERIISLRHLSTEANVLSTQKAGRGSSLSYQSQSDDDGTVVASDCHSPLIVQQEQRVKLATDYRRPTSPDDYPHGEEEEEEEEDEDEIQNVALMRAHTTLIKAPQNPFLSIPPPVIRLDTRGLTCSLDCLNQTLDMGKFMDQVTKISNGIDSIEMDLNDHKLNFLKDQTFRFKLYQKIEQEIIPNLIQLQATISSSNSDQHSFQPIAFPLKREQINLLASKLNSVLYFLINQLKSERRIIGNEIKYEWNKELSRCSVSNSNSRSLIAQSIEDASDSDSVKDEVDNFTLFKLMGLDETGRMSLSSCQSDTDEIHKRLNLAVRSSTRYPQARKSSLLILSEYDQLKQIQLELEQINSLLELVRNQKRKERKHALF